MSQRKIFDKVKNPTLRRVLTEKPIRARVFFVFSIVCALAFATFNAIAGVMYQSLWYGSLAVYYIFLIALKILLVVFSKYVSVKYADDEKKLIKERWRIYLINGVMLLVLDLALAASIVQMASMAKPTQTHMIIAIATAAYAFFRITTSIVNVIRNRKTDDIMLQVIFNISLVEATVSMLALTSTMISTFGDFESMRTMLLCVSVGAGMAIIFIGVLMIVRGAAQMKALLQNKNTN